MEAEEGANSRGMKYLSSLDQVRLRLPEDQAPGKKQVAIRNPLFAGDRRFLRKFGRTSLNQPGRVVPPTPETA